MFNGGIGIDLGTTYSCVSVLNNGSPEVLLNKIGERITPSRVYYPPEGRPLVGENTLGADLKDPQKLVYEIKRLMGKTFDQVREDAQSVPFPLAKDYQNHPYVPISGRINQYPEIVSSYILDHMKRIAERFLQEKVDRAVITVPAHFTHQQRKATKDAATGAGLKVLQLVHEPTAAAIAYGIEPKERKILVFDFGGGTFDVSILETENDDFEVVANGGESRLGGKDIDENLVEWCVEKFKKETDINISDDKIARKRLKEACEQAKKELSSQLETSIVIESLKDGQDFNSKISRALLEEKNKELFEKTMKKTQDTLDLAKLSKGEITDVLLVGGSSKIPKIKQMVENLFGEDKVRSNISCDEAVAFGAGHLAAVKTGMEGAQDIFLDEIIPHSLGIEIYGNNMSVILKRLKPIPNKNNHSYTTIRDNQTEIDFKIYEGESEVASKNHLIGQFYLEGIAKAQAGKPRINVDFEISENGLLEVKANEIGGNGVKNNLRVTVKGQGLSNETIEQVQNEIKFDSDTFFGEVD
eukprot:gb/GECH01011143.1/.p1 GENE.gb/GECH01011143.1/~~gb/GECH01011143.1/.p1  ORF type:complete len:527 (+),score=110.41 gb/GECH01011143.1/:1-1581(+)